MKFPGACVGDSGPSVKSPFEITFAMIAIETISSARSAITASVRSTRIDSLMPMIESAKVIAAASVAHQYQATWMPNT